ncbi:MAG: hypothetical protein TE42_03095 [Candidatus Synechococcus spongiarum SP3]|uniref:Uncharacterized protein n=1 Tax=Candidatus Synechococcus spongiarum SP3 TaxID=1604020 RepID=A0A0G2J5A7_9SYNE|nr:MAG: hypothetical protein TE42_03095 [Candidatus Synechococcus spongiarum SP3]
MNDFRGGFGLGKPFPFKDIGYPFTITGRRDVHMIGHGRRIRWSSGRGQVFQDIPYRHVPYMGSRGKGVPCSLGYTNKDSPLAILRHMIIHGIKYCYMQIVSQST